MTPQPLLSVERLGVAFQTESGYLSAVRDIDLTINSDEAVALVGESGSGKSATALAILGLLGTTARVQGEVFLNGINVVGASARQLRSIRAARVGIVFQDPQASLNPVMTIEAQLVETLRAHLDITRARAKQRALELLELAELTDPNSRLRSYPHELSGGMRQRVMLAIALACTPDLLIADEPTTALDVTVQAQILDTLDRMRRDLGMALLVITHDLGVANRLCDRIAVMYAGRIVEEGATRHVLDHPTHPYTRALLEGQPQLADLGRRLRSIEGSPPVLGEAQGESCSFAPRCASATEDCHDDEPELRKLGRQLVACFHPGVPA